MQKEMKILDYHTVLVLDILQKFSSSLPLLLILQHFFYSIVSCINET